ncbi:MAG: HepT-like ribonuclease domain-containing protein [Thermoplasmata archaeon]
MRPRDPRVYLHDIAQACELVLEFTKGKSFSDYASDPMLRAAVEREFEIMGEALRQALLCREDLGERISQADRVVAFRNRLIHGYATVSDEVVWGVVETGLPRLHEEVRALLEEGVDK